MKIYKHYSFDLWQTLIKSNPDFKPLRAQYFVDNYNPLKKERDEVITIIRDIDIMCNYANEARGKNIDCLEMYAMVLYQLGYPIKKVRKILLQKIANDIDVIFAQNPPSVYPGTVEVLHSLRRLGSTLSILSNTAFIRGCILNKFVKYGPLNHLFDFELYSDEAGFSKPNPAFFSQMLSRTAAMYPLFKVSESVIDASEIVHVGDNVIADERGAKEIGIDCIIINSNDKTIKDLL